MELSVLKYFIVIILLGLLTTCTAKPATRRDARRRRITCQPKMLAEYNLTFYGDWSPRLFPKHYPRVRPPAQWSKLVGRSHDDNYELWSPNRNCSDAVKAFTEDADSSMLDQDAQAYRGIFDSFTAAPIKNGLGRSAVRFLADGKHTKMSFMVKIIPSPDWFVGVNDLNLCHRGRWRRRIEMDLAPLDAGTDRGLTFTSPKWETEPRQPVRTITNSYPKHPAGSFHYADKDHLPRISHLVLTKVAEYKQRGKKLNASPTGPNVIIFDSNEDEKEDGANGNAKNRIAGQNSLMSTNEEIPRDCLVSEWTKWTSCSQTCGFGHKTRSRQVTQYPVYGGYGCPKLSDQSTCGSMRRCKWKHFNYLFKET